MSAASDALDALTAWFTAIDLSDVARAELDARLKNVRATLKPNGSGNGAATDDVDHGEESRLRLLTLSEFMQRPKVSQHIGRVVPKGAIIVAFGAPKGGKTYSITDLTMHAAHGMDWFGCRVREPKRVAYMIGEGALWLRVRLKAWFEYHDNVPPSSTFRIFDRPLPLSAQINDVIEMLRPFAPDILVTDTLNAYFGAGDENATKDMTSFCDGVRAIRDALGCSIIIIHHTGHTDQTRERGSIVLRASADVLVQVAKDEKDEKLVGFQVTYARDIETMQAPIALRLVPYNTEWLDEEGNPMVACVVQGADQSVTLPGRAKSAKPNGSGKNQQAAIVAVSEWARSHPEVQIIPTEELAALLSAQGLKVRQRRYDMIKHLVEVGLLNPSIGGHQINRGAL